MNIQGTQRTQGTGVAEGTPLLLQPQQAEKSEKEKAVGNLFTQAVKTDAPSSSSPLTLRDWSKFAPDAPPPPGLSSNIYNQVARSLRDWGRDYGHEEIEKEIERLEEEIEFLKGLGIDQEKIFYTRLGCLSAIWRNMKFAVCPSEREDYFVVFYTKKGGMFYVSDIDKETFKEDLEKLINDEDEVLERMGSSASSQQLQSPQQAKKTTQQAKESEVVGSVFTQAETGAPKPSITLKDWSKFAPNPSSGNIYNQVAKSLQDWGRDYSHKEIEKEIMRLEKEVEFLKGLGIDQEKIFYTKCGSLSAILRNRNMKFAVCPSDKREGWFCIAYNDGMFFDQYETRKENLKENLESLMANKDRGLKSMEPPASVVPVVSLVPPAAKDPSIQQRIEQLQQQLGKMLEGLPAGVICENAICENREEGIRRRDFMRSKRTGASAEQHRIAAIWPSSRGWGFSFAIIGEDKIFGPYSLEQLQEIILEISAQIAQEIANILKQRIAMLNSYSTLTVKNSHS